MTLGRSSQRQRLSEPSPYSGLVSTRETALQCAAAEGCNGALRYLIDEGIDIETCSPPHGNTPLWLAVHAGYRGTVELLLDAGAAIDSTVSSEGRTALFGALAPATLHTPYRRASQDGPTMLGFLLERGADPHIRDARGRRALHHAAAYGLLSEVDMLIKSGTSAEDAGDDETPLMMACEGHHPHLVRNLLERGVCVDRRDSSGETALVRLCQRYPCNASDSTTLRILFKYGADVNDCGSGYTPLYYALEKEDLELLRLLLRQGANIETVDSHSRSALGVFCYDLVDDRDDCRKIMSLLLDSGANPLLAGPGVESPLHLVATYKALHFGSRRALLQLLLQAGACTEVLDFRGDTVLSAVYHSEDLSTHERTAIGRFLLNNGANVNGASAAKAPIRARTLSRDMLKLLLEFGASLDTEDEQGNTVLDIAIGRGDEISVALLRRRGARVGRRFFGGVRIPAEPVASVSAGRLPLRTVQSSTGSSVPELETSTSVGV